MAHGRLRACLLASALTISCNDADPTGGIPGELSANRQAWNDIGLAHYTYDLTLICFCGIDPLDVVVEVQNGSIVAVRDRSSGTVVDPSKFSRYYSVEQLFALIEQENGRGAASIEVQYHPTMHYPVDIRIDRVANAVDDELAVRAENLQPA